jgi:Na+/H+ antiporter NhaD/arsenite permease-like protein
LTPRLSNSGFSLASAPSSVVQTGVKSFGCENSSAQLLPIQSWNLILPSVVSASKSGAIFLLTYAGVAIGRLPGLRIDRAGIALTGAAFTIAVGAISPEEAYRAIDLDTLALLLGMMIVVGHLRLSGFFRLGARWALEHAHSQPVFLVAVALTSGLLSAFLVNDAVCLVMAPLVVETTRALKRDPVPYLLAVAMASNVGSAATITGNPQNMIIGAFSHIPYVELGECPERQRGRTVNPLASPS